MGETEEIEYASRNQLGVGNGGDLSGCITGEGEGYSTQCVVLFSLCSSPRTVCPVLTHTYSQKKRYMLGVHNPRTNSLTLHAAPVHSIATNVQSLKAKPSLISSGALASIQRAALGQAFGTRKAIRAQNAEVRNKLNQDSYGTNAQIGTLLQASIAINASSLPTTEGVEREANLQRPIPPPNFDAKSPSEVYDLEDVVSGAELDAIDLEGILGVESQKERNQFLPYRRSSYIALKMRHLLPAIPTDSTSSEMIAHTPNRKDTLRLRLLVHLSHLLAFRQAIQGKSEATIDPSRIQTKLGEDFPPFLLGQLLERYTEVLRTGAEDKRKSSTMMENKLLGYFLVLVLKVDGYGTDVGTIANDLGIGSKRYVFVLLLSPFFGDDADLLCLILPEYKISSDL